MDPFKERPDEKPDMQLILEQSTTEKVFILLLIYGFWDTCLMSITPFLVSSIWYD